MRCRFPLLANAISGLNIFNYKAPIVTIQNGNGWIIGGSFKLVHVINLQQYATTLRQMENLTNRIEDQILAQHYINQTLERLHELMGNTGRARNTRSIDWLGSAWKWIAGSPDATDWSNILHSQNQIIQNSNHQYKVNKKLFTATQEVLEKIDEVVDRTNNVAKETEIMEFRQNALHNIFLLREDVSKMVRGCQLAKNGIVNTNLLDMDEINQILSEIETLPYQNIIEAIECGQPSVLTNGTLLLYVLSMPKVTTKKYNLLVTRAGIYGGKQLNLPFDRMLVNQEETYGLTKNCLVISSSTVCKSESLIKLEESSCLPRLLKGGEANCEFIRQNGSQIELINENTVFISNFQGVIKNSNASSTVNGTYVIQLNNETVTIGDQVFSSYETITAQALPAVLSKVKSHTMKVNLEYVHDLTMENIRYLGYVNEKVNFSLASEILSICAIVLIAAMLWRCYNRKLDLPPVEIPTHWSDNTNNSKIIRGKSAPEIHRLDNSLPATPVSINMSPGNCNYSLQHFTPSQFSSFDLRDADL